MLSDATHGSVSDDAAGQIGTYPVRKVGSGGPDGPTGKQGRIAGLGHGFRESHRVHCVTPAQEQVGPQIARAGRERCVVRPADWVFLVHNQPETLLSHRIAHSLRRRDREARVLVDERYRFGAPHAPRRPLNR